MRGVTTHRGQVVFRGNGLWCPSCARALLPLYLVLFTVFLLFSVLFLGVYWHRMFLFFFLTGAPIGFGLYVITFSGDWFRFNDDKKWILMTWRTRIPYGQVKSIQVREVRDHLEVDINRKRKYEGRNLISHLALEEEGRLMSELTHRFPSVEISETKIKPSGQKIMALFVLVVLLGCLGALYASFFVYLHTFPGIEVTPEKPLWQPMEKVDGHEYSLKAFSFFLPQDFGRFAEREEWLVLRHKHKKAKLKVVYNSDISALGKHRLVRYMMGVRDEHDARTVAYNARFGLVPLALKAFYFHRFHVMRIHEVEPNGLKGFVIRGRRGSIWMAEIALFDKEKGLGIYFTLSSMEPIGQATLATIVSGVRRVDQPGD